MSDKETEHIIILASEIGHMLRLSPASIEYNRALTALKESEEGMALFSEYSDRAAALSEIFEAGQNIDPAERQSFAELRDKALSNPVISALMIGADKYAELLEKIKAELDFENI